MNTELRHASWPSLILQPHAWTLGILLFIIIDVFVNMNISRGRKRIWFWHLRVAADKNWHPHFMEAPHRIYKPPPPVPVLSHINPFHVFPLHFLKMHFILSSHLFLGHPSCLLPSGLSNKTSCISLVSHTCHVSLPVSFSSVWSPAHLADLGWRTVPNGRDITAKIHTLTVLPTWQLRVLAQKRAVLLLMRRTVMFWYFFLSQNVVTKF